MNLQDGLVKSQVECVCPWTSIGNPRARRADVWSTINRTWPKSERSCPQLSANSAKRIIHSRCSQPKMFRINLKPPFCLFCLKQTWQSVDVRDYKLLRLLDVSVPLSVGRTHDKRRWYPNANKNEVAAHLAAQCVRIGMKVLLFAQDTRFVMAISDKINNLLDEKLDENKLPDRCKKLIGLLLDEAGSKDVLLVPTGRAACHNGLMLPAEREVTEFVFREPSYVD